MQSQKTDHQCRAAPLRSLPFRSFPANARMRPTRSALVNIRVRLTLPKHIDRILNLNSQAADAHLYNERVNSAISSAPGVAFYGTHKIRIPILHRAAGTWVRLLQTTMRRRSKNANSHIRHRRRVSIKPARAAQVVANVGLGVSQRRNISIIARDYFAHAQPISRSLFNRLTVGDHGINHDVVLDGDGINKPHPVISFRSVKQRLQLPLHTRNG